MPARSRPLTPAEAVAAGRRAIAEKRRVEPAEVLAAGRRRLAFLRRRAVETQREIEAVEAQMRGLEGTAVGAAAPAADPAETVRLEAAAQLEEIAQKPRPAKALRQDSALEEIGPQAPQKTQPVRTSEGKGRERQPTSPLTQHGAATPGSRLGDGKAPAGNVAKPQLGPTAHRVEHPSGVLTGGSSPAAPAPAKPIRLWTAERDEALRRMWIDEGLTQSAIAAVLTGEVGRPVSRNAIAKRVSEKRWAGLGAVQGFRRVGVTLGGGAPEKAGKLSAVLEALPTGERRPEPACVPETASQHPPGAWPIADLREGQCRFACTPDDAPSHRFCGAPTRAGRGNLHGSWCAAHLPVVWERGTESERSAGGVLRRLG